MNFSKTTEYALKILSYMALDYNKLYSAEEIFKELKIPYRYLRKQLTILSKSDLIKSIQGKFGGYKLSKKLEDISLLDIIVASGDKQLSNNCFFGFNECAFQEKCSFHNKWEKVRTEINMVLSTTNLAELKSNGPHGHANSNLLLTKIN
ncbi:MAG: Rrf2 family transcriptional regulator [Bacteroidetes bacterium]|nr:Rrf2 family transcriptional regulator [Bacteroidota bacterium]MBL6943909.1 Rrf2 family transcriptional regulator [Bacteroidales bacterium]